MATRVIQHDNVRGYNELRVALSEALLAKNTQARCKGYSPLQWVLGYEESLPGSVLERPQDLAAHSMALDEEDLGAAFRRRLQMREMARKAWIEMDNSDRIRQALTRRPQGLCGPLSRATKCTSTGRDGPRGMHAQALSICRNAGMVPQWSCLRVRTARTCLFPGDTR